MLGTYLYYLHNINLVSENQVFSQILCAAARLFLDFSHYYISRAQAASLHILWKPHSIEKEDKGSKGADKFYFQHT